MTEKKRKKNVTVRLDWEFHRLLNSKLRGEGTTFQFVIIQALTKWYEEKNGVLPKPIAVARRKSGS